MMPQKRMPSDMLCCQMEECSARCLRLLLVDADLNETQAQQEAFQETHTLFKQACGEERLFFIASWRHLAKMRRATSQLVDEVKVRKLTSDCGQRQAQLLYLDYLYIYVCKAAARSKWTCDGFRSFHLHTFL